MTPTTGPNAPLPGGNLDPTKRVGGAAPSKPGVPSADAPAFRALLDRLETQAKDLAREKDGVDRPEELSQATDLARETLTGALELRDQLLEAYRQAQSNKPVTPEDASE